MKPFMTKFYVAFNGMPMQECKTAQDARDLRKSIIARQMEIQDGDFSEDKLSVLKLQMFKLSN